MKTFNLLRSENLSHDTIFSGVAYLKAVKWREVKGIRL
jgi:hypothetical protein